MRGGFLDHFEAAGIKASDFAKHSLTPRGAFVVDRLEARRRDVVALVPGMKAAQCIENSAVTTLERGP